jgi:DNA helicase-2/ATP-dependent DNA helicase PcrA
MVDEYQDVNPSQEMLISLMHAISETLFVVGDDDQAIYAWRGADVGNILSFRQRYQAASPHTLGFNFRSTPAIVQAADGFIRAELGPTRITKNPQAQNPQGTRDFRRLWFDDRDQEARWIVERIQSLLGTTYHEADGRIRGLTLGDFAIIMRSTRGTSGPPHHAAFTEQLEAANITYALESGGGLFDRPHVAAMRDTFELLRQKSPTRDTALSFFNTQILPCFPHANFQDFTEVLMEWGRKIHAPITGPRRRVYLQQFVHDLLGALHFQQSNFNEGILYAIGIFSRIIQDVETVYVSVDTASRYREVLNFLGNVADSGYELSTEDLLVRPDAVMVSTIHKVKGLEYPVVFVADAENQRFPLAERDYYGWLPRQVIGPALARGRYKRTATEEARLFYTAITRAERYLYVSGAAHLPSLNKQRHPSNFSLRLAHAELSEDGQSLPPGLTPCAQARRVDETLLPTTFSDVRYYLRCPADYNLRKRLGFSPPIKEMFGFGQTVHAVIGRLHQVCKNQSPSEAETTQIANSTFHLKHVPQSNNPAANPGPYERAKERAAQIAKDYVGDYGEDFTSERQVEIQFEVPLDKAVITGTIDLILNCDAQGQIIGSTIIDFKTLAAGDAPEDNEEMDWTELSLQVQLYAKAANEVLGQNAKTGAVHFLKDGQRIEVPVTDDAINAAVENVKWAVEQILDQDFPMRPYAEKCQKCDFNQICLKVPEQFRSGSTPPAIYLPGPDTKMARAFSEFQP